MLNPKTQKQKIQPKIDSTHIQIKNTEPKLASHQLRYKTRKQLSRKKMKKILKKLDL